jgi:hypothetical protein
MYTQSAPMHAALCLPSFTGGKQACAELTPDQHFMWPTLQPEQAALSHLLVHVTGAEAGV